MSWVEKAKSAPQSPGVYIFKDGSGRPIYIGKAANLRKRLAAYIRGNIHAERLAKMLQQAQDLEIIVTTNEAEALLLEDNLLKKEKPRYNVALLDDKSYPYIEFTMGDRFPRVLLSRRRPRKDSIYFGPFASASAARKTIRLLQQVFKIAVCNYDFRRRKEPCLYWHIGRCLAPCAGKISRKEYMEAVRDAIAFMRGKTSAVLKRLEKEMWEAAEKLQYERAARIRDLIRAIREVSQEQRVVLGEPLSVDVIGWAEGRKVSAFEVLVIREGRLIGARKYRVEGAVDREALERVVWERLKEDPPDIFWVKETFGLSGLSSPGGKRVRVEVPRRDGEKVLALAMENAKREVAALESVDPEASAGMRRLGEVLGIPTPRFIIGVDTSALQGTEFVASVVAFINGEPEKSLYRRYRIQSEGRFDDYRAIGEAVERYVSKMLEEDNLPDLILIDGGKGQLSAALSALRRVGVFDVAVVALAKKREEIYVPFSQDPLRLPLDDPGLRLLVRVRDEAHRFAVSYHRLRMRKRMLDQELLKLPGVGPQRARKLLLYFGSIESLRKASMWDIAKVPGIGSKLAKKIWEALHF